MSEAQLRARVAELEASLLAKEKQAQAAIGVRFGEKGGIMVTGLGKFPTTLYAEQWARVFAVKDKIEELMKQAKPREYKQAQAVG